MFYLIFSNTSSDQTLRTFTFSGCYFLKILQNTHSHIMDNRDRCNLNITVREKKWKTFQSHHVGHPVCLMFASWQDIFSCYDIKVNKYDLVESTIIWNVYWGHFVPFQLIPVKYFPRHEGSVKWDKISGNAVFF